MPDPAPKKRTPSARVIAFYVIRKVLADARSNLTAEDLAAIAGSRVNGAKREKVFEQFEKIVKSLQVRTAKAIDAHENPTARPGRTPPRRRPASPEAAA